MRPFRTTPAAAIGTVAGLAVGCALIFTAYQFGEFRDGGGNDPSGRGIAGGYIALYFGPPLLVATVGAGLFLGLWTQRRRAQRTTSATASGVMLGMAVAMIAVAVIGAVLPLLVPFDGLISTFRYAWPTVAAAAFVGAAGGAVAARRWHWLATAGPTQCRGCGYDLVGTLGIDCPECGHRIPPEQCRHLDRVQAQQQKNP